MIKSFKKRLITLGMGVFLFSYTCLAGGFVSCATDYAAEEEARRSLPDRKSVV